MQRLAKLDVSHGFARPGSRLAAQLAFGIACALAMGIVRSLVDLRVPTAGPFALVYPTILIATLFGHWRAGMVAFVLTFGWAWYVVLPYPYSFSFQLDTDPARVAVNAGANLIVLVLAEAFRRAVRQAMAARDAEIARRSLLLRELEHRTKNNFALVLSLLELQRKRAIDTNVKEALELATARIHSFAAAYANLAESQGEGESVAMQPYLGDVVRRLTEGAFDERVSVRHQIADIVLPREVAVAIGLFTNEALTNCAKYAFPAGQSGTVEVLFVATGTDWQLSVSDDGIGEAGRRETASAGSGAGSGLGTTLMRAFAQQAQATSSIEKRDRGRRVTLTSS